MIKTMYKTNPVTSSNPAVVPGQVKVPYPVKREKKEKKRKYIERGISRVEQEEGERDIRN